MPIQRWSEDIWVAQLTEEPAISEDMRNLHDQLEASTPTPNVVIDLSGVRMVNSSNLAQMLRIRKLAIDREIHLRIAAPNDVIWAAMLTTGLDKVFELAEDVPSALAAIQMKSE
jgi:anti-anti-sigma factor